METIIPNIIQPLIPQLGFAGVFVYLYLKFRTESREDIKRKDEEIKTMNERLFKLVENNTIALVELQGVVGTMADQSRVTEGWLQTIARKEVK